jgi:hypothetical protein
MNAILKSVTLPNGQQARGRDIPVIESTERWSELRLADGSVLRVKMCTTAVVRVDGGYDNQGQPMYVLEMTPVMGIVSVPEALLKK